jgi:hypothetical protein
MSSGPRYRIAEEQLQAMRAGHAREMRQLRDYVDNLRNYGETMRMDLEDTKRQLARAQGR